VLSTMMTQSSRQILRSHHRVPQHHLPGFISIMRLLPPTDVTRTVQQPTGPIP
jgi:hypothetical protein